MSNAPATPASPTMSQAEYARHRGVSRAAVHKAVHQGRIPMAGDGRIDPVAADAAWRSNTDPSRPGKPGASGPPVPANHVPTPGDGEAYSPLSFHDAKALREYNLASLAGLELRQRRGELIEADEVRDVAFRAARAARDLILAAPDRLAPLITGLTDQADVHRILREDLLRACEELVKADPAAAETEQAAS